MKDSERDTRSLQHVSHHCGLQKKTPFRGFLKAGRPSHSSVWYSGAPYRPSVELQQCRVLQSPPLCSDTIFNVLSQPVPYTAQIISNPSSETFIQNTHLHPLLSLLQRSEHHSHWCRRKYTMNGREREFKEQSFPCLLWSHACMGYLLLQKHHQQYNQKDLIHITEIIQISTSGIITWCSILQSRTDHCSRHCANVSVTFDEKHPASASTGCDEKGELRFCETAFYSSQKKTASVVHSSELLLRNQRQ